jgi:hypothetical protein
MACLIFTLSSTTGPDVEAKGVAETISAGIEDFLDLVEAGMFKWVKGAAGVGKSNQKPCHRAADGHAKI